MLYLGVSRAVWTRTCVALASCVMTGPTLAQDPPSSQPASQPAEAVDESAAAAAPAGESDTATRPARVTRPPRVTPPATQAARDRLSRFQQLNKESAESAPANGAAQGGDPSAAAQETPAPTTQEDPAAARRRRAEEARKRLEERRKAAREAAEARLREQQAAAGGGAGQGEDAEAAANEEETQPSEAAPAAQSEPQDEAGAEVDEPQGAEPEAPARPGRRTGRTPSRAGRVEAPRPTPTDEPQVGAPLLPTAERTEFMNFVDMPWEDVVKLYAKRVGKPFKNVRDVIIGGTLTYQSERRFSPTEMLDELNFLLAEQGYFLKDHGDYVYLLPFNEIGKYLAPNEFYQSLEEFNAAKLRDMEFASVTIPIKERSAQEVQEMLAPSMPDYAMPVVIGDTNAIKIVGLAKDVRRFSDLMNIINTEEFDPRQTRFFKIKTNVVEIERMVREMFDLGPARSLPPSIARNISSRSRTRTPTPTPGAAATEEPDTTVRIMADERTKTLIVKAIPDKLKEIEKFILEIDAKPDIGDFDTHVIPLQHGNAADIAEMLNSIFQQERGQTQPPQRFTRTPTRSTRQTTANTGTPSPEDIIVEDLFEQAKKTVRLVADERSNALIVYANEDGLKRVNELLKIIDVEVPSNFRTFKLEHAEAADVHPVIESIVRGMTGATPGRGRSRSATVTLDAPNNALHVIAEREDMQRVEDVIRQLDIAGAQEERHVIQLNNVRPSEMTTVVETLLKSTGATPGAARRGSRGGPAAVATSRVIALDAARTLIVMCTEEEWKKVEDTIRIWDETAVSAEPRIEFFEIANGDPASIGETLTTLYRQYRHPVLGPAAPAITVDGSRIMVQGIQPVLAEIEALLPSLDVAPAENPLVILPLQFADAAQVAQLAQSILPAGAVRGRGGRAPAGASASVQAEPVTNSLIIQADELTRKRVVDFAKDMEQQVAAQQPERRTYDLHNAVAADVVRAINDLLGGAGAAGPRGRGAVGSQIKAVVAGNQIIVDAPAAKQSEIATLVAQLDGMSDKGISTLLVKMPAVDVVSIAQKMTRVFQQRVRSEGSVATFEADPQTETILITVSKDVQEEAEKLLEEYRDAAQPLIEQTEFYQLKNASAAETHQWLKEQLVALMDRQFGRAAAQQVRVTPDTRTNKLVISAPQVAVTMAKTLLEQYDVPITVQETAPPPVVTGTRKLPGLDVENIARMLERQFNALPARADKLKRTFSSDRLMEMVVFTVPKDEEKSVDETIARFVEETSDLQIERRTIPVEKADATYVGNMVKNTLSQQISGRRGQDVWSKVNIQVDTRMNRLIVSAPKFAIEMVEALTAELDQEPTVESALHTLPLAHADANTILNVLNGVFREKIQAKVMQVSVEPISNALIVGANERDFEQIQKWVQDLDQNAAAAISEPRIYDLKNANPYEVLSVLNTTFAPQGAGRRVAPGKEVRISILAGRSLVVQAPAEKMDEIDRLITELDSVGANEAVVRTFRLPGFGTQLNQLATQVSNAVNARLGEKERKINVTAVPASDALIVTALEKQLPAVEKAMEQFKGLNQPPKLATLKLNNANADVVAQALSKLMADRVSAGRVRITSEALNNILIVSAAEEDMREIQEWATKFDGEVGAEPQPETIDLKYADPAQLQQMLTQMFASRDSRRGAAPDVQISVSNATLIVKAPEKKLEAIKALVKEIDAEDKSQLEVKTYALKLLNAEQVAAKVQGFLLVSGQLLKGGSMKPGAFAEPTTNTLIVMAPRSQMPFIDGLIQQIENGEMPQAEPRSYDLVNVKADQVAANIQQMLTAKVNETAQGKAGIIKPVVVAEPSANRLFVVCPPDYHELAAQLIKMVDREADNGEIVHILPLQQADAATVAQTATALAQRKGGRVAVSADAASNSLVLAGMPRDVAEIERTVKELDVSSNSVPELQIFKIRNADVLDVSDALANLFPGTTPADKVTVTEDDYYARLIVSASKRKMRQVEQVIAQLDAAPDIGEDSPDGRELYFVDINRGDAFDIAWDVSDYFPPSDKGGPTIDSDLFGEYITVKCRPNEFPRIEKLIREFERRAKAEIVLKEYKPKLDVAKYAEYIRLRNPDVRIDMPADGKIEPESIIETLHPEGEAPPAERKGARRPPGAREGALSVKKSPFALAMYKGKGPQDEPLTSQPTEMTLEEFDRDRRSESPLPKEETAITVLPDGRFILRGPKTDVENLEDTFDLIESDLSKGEVIRIFKFKYGDVNAASRILQLMFNEPQQIRFGGFNPQQLQQQLQQAQQGGAGGGRGGRGQRGGGGAGEDGGGPAGLLGGLQGLLGGGGGGGRQPAGGGGGSGQGGGDNAQPSAPKQLRIATDASHSYLIIKCDESQLPEIRQLLKEIDIPPSEVELKVIQLHNIDAREAAENLKAALGITKAQASSAGRQGGGLQNLFGGGGGAAGFAQAQLLNLFMQSGFSMPASSGGEGPNLAAKIESTEIVPNQVTNSLLVSAPPEVMTLIEDTLGKMEELEGRDVTVIDRYELKNARVDDVLPLLQEIFAGAIGARSGGGRGAAVSSPADLGPVTISGDPRNNTLVFSAQQKDIALIREQIAQLDFEGAIAEVETYACQYGDAASIASVVSEIFAKGGAAPAGPGRRGAAGAAPTSSTEVRITAEPTTNTILVWGPEDQRALIFAEVEKLDEQSRRDIREIPVKNANPERLAEKLSAMFGGAIAAAPTGAGIRGRSAAASVASTAGKLVIFGSKDAGKLLVRAPDGLFQQIKDAVAVLDTANADMLVRRYQLKHANAQVVVDAVKATMVDFIANSARLGADTGDLNVDAFTAVAEPRTNSILVLGSEQTFGFVEMLLTQIDVATPDDQLRQFRVFVLRETDANIVADMINNFAAGGGGASPASAAPAGRGARGGGMAGLLTGPSLGAGETLDVTAVAEPSTNSVMVSGKPADIETVAKAVIDPLESANVKSLTAIPVKNLTPTQVAAFVIPLVATEGAGGVKLGPQITPNDGAKTLIVYGTESEVGRVSDLVDQFDVAGLESTPMKIIPLPFGQDAPALASEVQRIVNEGESIMAQSRGLPARQVTIGSAEDKLLVYGDASLYAMVEDVVKQVTEGRGQVVTRVVELVNLASDDAVGLINDLQNRSGANRGGVNRGGTSPTPPRAPRVQPSTPSTPRVQPSTPSRGGRQQPSGGSRTTPRRNPGQRPPGGAVNWTPLRDVLDSLVTPDELAPALGAPLAGVHAVSPSVLMATLFQATQEEPQQAPATSPARDRRRPVPASQAAPPQQAINSISGELRGEVLATPVDSKRIIITGDQRDVEFILKTLAMMDETTPQPQVRVFKLEHSKASAVAPVVQSTMEAIIDTSGGAGDRTNRFSIIAEGRSNSLIVSASETNMQDIELLIQQLDVDTLEGSLVRVFPLEHIRASEAVQVIEPMLQQMNVINQVPAEAQAKIQPVERSNSVFAVGTAADLASIEEMLQGIDVEIPPVTDFNAAWALFAQLKNASAEELATVLNELIEAEKASASGAGGAASGRLIRRLMLTTKDGRELPPLDLDRPIRIVPEKGTNSLVIFSSPKNNEALKEIVELFDTPPTGAEVDVKSIALGHAKASVVAEMVQRMFDEGKGPLRRPAEGAGTGIEPGVMPPVSPTRTGQGLAYNVFVTADDRTNNVFVVGRKDAVVLAAGVITELDRPSADLGLRPHLVRLQNYEATRMQEKLQEMLDQRAQAMGSQENVARDSAIIVPDDRSNALIVLANDDLFGLIENLAKQLDAAESYRIVASQWRRLKFADATKLASLLQSLFEKKASSSADVTEGGQKDVLHVLADGRSNSLLLTGTRDYLVEAEGLIDKFDQSFDPTVEFKVRPVVLNSASNIATLLTDMIEKSLAQTDSELKSTPIHVSADPYSNNLLLAASREDMQMLERWIEVLDRPAEPGRVTRIIPLLRGNAEELSQQMADMFKPTSGEAGQDVTVTFDKGTNSVIAIGPPVVVNDIANLLTSLDDVDPQGGDQFKAFKLAEADAASAGALLRSILEGRSGSVGTGGAGGTGGSASDEAVRRVMLMFQQEHPELGAKTLRGLRSAVTIIDDERTNSLYVTAPPETMPLIESLIKAVDIPPDAQKVQIYALRNSDAEQMVETLRDLFEEAESGGVGGAGAGGSSAEGPRLTLGESLGRVSFTADTRTNSVIAAGTPGYLKKVEEIVLQLDSQPIEARKQFVYHPRNNPAVAIQEAVKQINDEEKSLMSEMEEDVSKSQQLARQVVAVASEDTNRVILSYDPRREGDVLELVKELDQPPPQVMIQVMIVEVTMNNNLELGVEFAFQDLEFTKAGPTDTTTFDLVGGTDIGAAGAGLGGFTFTITGADFNFLFRTLQSEGNLNILSRPQVVAQDNQEARIEIVNDVPYVAGTQTSTTGQISTAVQREEVGIRLQVTPHINPDGFVRMEIEQEVSDITPSTVDVGQGVTSPIFFRRVANTTVTVKDSETIVLGGLITSRAEDNETKIPILGDIPLAGLLFSDRQKQTSRTELLIILTPTIIREVEDFRRVSAKERDRLTVIPDDYLTSDLMAGLRVPPEELRRKAGENLVAPTPEEILKERPQDDIPYDPDVYGPTRKPLKEPPVEEDSYDIPLSRAKGSSAPALAGRK